MIFVIWQHSGPKRMHFCGPNENEKHWQQNWFWGETVPKCRVFVIQNHYPEEIVNSAPPKTHKSRIFVFFFFAFFVFFLQSLSSVFLCPPTPAKVWERVCLLDW